MKELFYDDITEAEKFKTELLERVIRELHLVLKHDLKTGILAQMRAFEYIISKFGSKESKEFINLIKLSYETSLSQYEIVKRELEVFGD